MAAVIRLMAALGLLAASAQSAWAALEGEWLGSFAKVTICGDPATLTDFHLRITSAPFLHLSREQFRYARANITGPAGLTVASRDGGDARYEIAGMFIGALVAASTENMLVGYIVSTHDYDIWRQRKPFAPPTDSVEAMLTVHGNWTSINSMTGTLRVRGRCGPAGTSERLRLDGVLSKH